jgi:mutual gliding-motility protein MglA
MASIDHNRKRISAAVLLYGPPGAGKTTALYALARQLPPGTHGKVGPLHGGDDRLIRLDYRPNDQELVYGYQVSFRLVACPGSIEVDLLRPMLGAVDAVMFVADSSRQAMQANVKALELLDRMVRSAGRELADVPMVLLYNKRDLREAVEIRTLEEKLNKNGASYIAASAVRGQGVLDGLQRLTASVAVQVRQQVQAAGGGKAGGNVQTVAHGQTWQGAQRLHKQEENEDHTAVSADAGAGGGANWAAPDDDRTEVNHAQDPWEADPGSSDWVAEPGDRTKPRGSRQREDLTDYTSPSPDRRDSAVDEWKSAPQASAAPVRQANPPSRGRSLRPAGGFRELTPLQSKPVSTPRPAPPEDDGNALWRTPAEFADDVDADDRTMPFREAGDFEDDDLPGVDDITQSHVGRGSTSPASSMPDTGRIRTTLEPVRARGQQARAPQSRTPPARPAQARPAPARSLNAERPSAAVRGGVAPARARRVEQTPAPPMPRAHTPQVQAAPVVQAVPAAPPFAAQPAHSPGVPGHTATQVINAFGREPEAWEAALAHAHVMKVPVAELAGYVVSRIGTPKASTRRTVQIPVRATHMDTLMPQDFMLEVEFRGGGNSAGPAVSARRAPAMNGDARNVPMSWFVGAIALSAVALVAIVIGLTSLS